jgi:hypothetical protein
MQYRPYGRTGVSVSALGFGCMRLPMTGNRVDRDLALPMLLRAYELGVNYFDTGKWYCAQDSERTLGEAVKGMDRSKIFLTTKYAQEKPTAADLREKFETSLKLMQIEYVDFYHLWGLSWDSFEKKMALKGGPLEAFLKLKDEGLVRHLSTSFHSKAEDLKKLADTGCFETILCQYNLLDRANEEAIAYAASKGVGVAIMGTVGGGRLGTPSEVLGGILPGAARVSTPELALRFVLSNPNVSAALSGMSTMQQVEENIATASRDSYLTPEEREKIAQAMAENRRLAELYCTGCKYCMRCPHDVNIPRVFELMNYYRVYGLQDYARREYLELTAGRAWPKDLKDASKCEACGECEEKCPQKLKIAEQLKEAHRVLTAGT